MWETWVQSLGWEDPLEKGKATHSCFGLESSKDCVVHGAAKRWTRLSHVHFHFKEVDTTEPRALSLSGSLRLLLFS